MDPQLATMAAQFGVAGLIGWMWLTERKGAMERDRQLADAQALLGQSQKGVEVLLKALEDNTRAIAALEGTQRGLIDALGRRKGSE
jgi:hypothetical protein